MKQIIAFIYKEENERTKKYLNILNTNNSNFLVKSFETLNDEELNICEVAIVLDATAKQLKMIPNLIWIQSLKAGVETLVDTLKDSKVQITRLIDPELSYSMASSVLAWVYFIQKNMNQYKIQQESKHWNPLDEKDNKDTNIAILGLGNLGLECAKKLLENDFNVSAWARSKKEVKNITMYYEEDGLENILKNADIIVCLLPSSKATLNIIDTQKIALFKKGASFINFGRGGIVDYKALEISIDKRDINHAVLDVFIKEPLEESSSLWKNKNISILPHISALTNINSASKIALNNINNFYVKDELPLFVDKVLGY